MNYQFDFHFLNGSLPLLWEGLQVTLKLALVSNAIGLVCGFGLCLMTLSRWFFIRMPAQMFIELFRCTPVLLQVVWFFYCVPMLFNVFIDPLMMGFLALGLNMTAFNSEAYRAGVQAVPREHLDACVALGLKAWQRTLFVVLPQALRTATPVLMTNAIGGLQQTALVAIVAVGDLMYVAKMLATDAYRPLETYSLVALIYFALSFPVAQLVQYIERRQDAASSRSQVS